MENVTAIDSADVPLCTTVQKDGAGTVYVTMEIAVGRRSVPAGEALRVVFFVKKVIRGN